MEAADSISIQFAISLEEIVCRKSDSGGRLNLKMHFIVDGNWWKWSFIKTASVPPAATRCCQWTLCRICFTLDLHKNQIPMRASKRINMMIHTRDHDMRISFYYASSIKIWVDREESLKSRVCVDIVNKIPLPNPPIWSPFATPKARWREKISDIDISPLDIGYIHYPHSFVLKWVLWGIGNVFKMLKNKI